MENLKAAQEGAGPTTAGPPSGATDSADKAEDTSQHWEGTELDEPADQICSLKIS